MFRAVKPLILIIGVLILINFGQGESAAAVSEASSSKEAVNPVTPPLWCWLLLSGLAILSGLILVYEIPKNRNRGQEKPPFKFDQ